jgi:hypothetical protein
MQEQYNMRYTAIRKGKGSVNSEIVIIREGVADLTTVALLARFGVLKE